MRLTEDAMDGRRSRASKSPSVPKYGLASPFRGHFSTKSNAFCTGSSGRLSDQFRIQDHMLSHYNKILSAKAAVDSSMPKSMLTSIKYSDQQRREKLKKEVARYEQEFLSARSLSRPSSGVSASQGSSEHRKSSYDIPDSIDTENGQLYCTRSLFSPPIPYLVSPSLALSTDSAKKVSGTYHKTSTPRKHFSAVSLSSSEGSLKCSPNFQKFQDHQKKTYSGDLLDLHSEQFTNKQQRFTPRTLKTEAKSVLAQYRYYTPARRKKKDEVSEAEAQTEISSFKKYAEPSEKKDPLEESQWAVDEDEHSEMSLTAEDIEQRMVSFQDAENLPGWSKLVDHPFSLSRVSSSNSVKSPSPVMRKVKTEEEELLYLEFVAQITNEILTLGLFSSRVLARVFERHIEDNKHRLDEGKMRHLLDILRVDLGYKAEEDSGSVNDNSDTMATLQEDISKTMQNQRYHTRNGRGYADSTGYLRTESKTLQQSSEKHEYLKKDPRDSLSDKMGISLAIHQQETPDVSQTQEIYSSLEEFLKVEPNNSAWDETESSPIYTETPDLSVVLKKHENFEEFFQKGPKIVHSNIKDLSALQEAPDVLLTLPKYRHIEEFLKENLRPAPSGKVDSYPGMLQEDSPDVIDTIEPTLNPVKHDSAIEKTDESKESCDLRGSFEETPQQSKEKGEVACNSLVKDFIPNSAETGSEGSDIVDVFDVKSL
ncbi:spermatogenesis-associated protein 7 [Microcaecilia unicolor]|uniref:Spermatogenesis-associated protein 7 n=1 Tax=Microcaecilia unicolor TaxID=1415580 RepID=A0A6P7YYW0_9AMPH|nr:spermatogenesis-associated protein 7 [Microcaecilia unicolor]